MYLSQYELQILQILQHSRDPRGQAEMSDELDVPPFTARAALAALRRAQLIRRDQRYRFAITQAGRNELARRNQLSVVP